MSSNLLSGEVDVGSDQVHQLLQLRVLGQNGPSNKVQGKPSLVQGTPERCYELSVVIASLAL